MKTLSLIRQVAVVCMFAIVAMPGMSFAEDKQACDCGEYCKVLKNCDCGCCDNKLVAPISITRADIEKQPVVEKSDQLTQQAPNCQNGQCANSMEISSRRRSGGSCANGSCSSGMTTMQGSCANGSCSTATVQSAPAPAPQLTASGQGTCSTGSCSSAMNTAWTQSDFRGSRRSRGSR